MNYHEWMTQAAELLDRNAERLMNRRLHGVARQSLRSLLIAERHGYEPRQHTITGARLALAELVGRRDKALDDGGWQKVRGAARDEQLAVRRWMLSASHSAEMLLTALDELDLAP